MNEKVLLNKDWQLKLLNSNDTEISFNKDSEIPATVPGTVHTDLLNAGLISEPYYADNELKLKWIDLCDWSYCTRFDVPPEMELTKKIHLVFEGIDTVADIILNGQLLGTVRNMFIKYEYEVSSLLKVNDNFLELKFYSPKRFSLNEEKRYGKIPVPLSTDSDRVYLRKAQYSYGWDWGPAFTTMGIWRNVYLQQKPVALIQDVKFDTIEIKGSNADCELSFSIATADEKKFNTIIEISDQSGNIIYTDELIYAPENHLKISLSDIKLWWPNGMGSPTLYNLNIKLIDNEGIIVNKWRHKVGIRTIELILEENNQPTYKFIINGKTVYIKGVNWIPGDSFLTRVTSEKYSRLLNLVKDASMNMVRVWGGGIYENDEFYEICDELGLLVWQDCMFACGSYPEHEEFLESVENEIEYNLNRIRNHTSIAILCGNNENEWIWTMDHKSSYTEMPGYKIYHELIPGIAGRICPKMPYWPSSPYGFDEDPNSETSGNRHQWYIWSGWKDYSTVVEDNSLFVTEFGFQGPANTDTFMKYLPEENLKIHNRLFEFHNKQVEGPERIMKFLSGHLPLPKTWDEYIYLAQLNQGFALKACLEHWRSNQPTTNGSIIWQINDTWPVTSWALVDSEEQPKLSYNFVKRAFNKVLLTIKREDDRLNVIMVNESDKVHGELITKLYGAESCEQVQEWRNKVNYDESLHSIILELNINDIKTGKDWIIVSTLYNDEEIILFRNYYCEKRWKHIKLNKVKINLNSENNSVKLSTDKPAFFVDIYHPGITFQERGLIILPGEEVTVIYNELSGAKLDLAKLKITTLNEFLN